MPRPTAEPRGWRETHGAVSICSLATPPKWRNVLIGLGATFLALGILVLPMLVSDPTGAPGRGVPTWLGAPRGNARLFESGPRFPRSRESAPSNVLRNCHLRDSGGRSRAASLRITSQLGVLMDTFSRNEDMRVRRPITHRCCSASWRQQKPPEIRGLCGARYWDRTSDLFRVREARYRCANRAYEGCLVVKRGGDGIRTRVNGFAGRCLAARPRHRVWFDPRVVISRR